MKTKNILEGVPSSLPEEWSEVVARGEGVRVERIVSRGHCSGVDTWYDPTGNEWVMVVQGHARLEVAGETDLVEMKAGDWVIIPAHVRHRVAWTDPLVDTLWLAVHYAGEPGFRT